MNNSLPESADLPLPVLTSRARRIWRESAGNEVLAAAQALPGRRGFNHNEVLAAAQALPGRRGFNHNEVLAKRP